MRIVGMVVIVFVCVVAGAAGGCFVGFNSPFSFDRGNSGMIGGVQSAMILIPVGVTLGVVGGVALVKLAFRKQDK